MEPGPGPGPGPSGPSGPEWQAKVNKWEHGIDTIDTSNEDLLEYIQVKTYLYRTEEAIDQDLWDLYQEEFESFTVAILKTIGTKTLQMLRNTLRARGVYIQKNDRHTTLAEVLYATLKEDERHQWTDEEIKIASTEVKIESRQLQQRLRAMNLIDQSIPPSIGPSDHSQKASIPQDLPQNQEPLLQQLEPQLHQLRISNTSKLVSDIAKILTENQKYDGTNGSFDHKLTIFLDICQRVELPNESIMKAFPTMLKGLAQDHFYNNQLSQRPYKEVCTNLRNFFEGPGYHRRNLDQWNATTLASIIAENPQKSTYENVQLLINTLRQLQYGLTQGLRSIEFLHNKLVTACQGSPACRYAVADPPSDLGSLIHKLQSSITSYEKEQETQNETFYTDRRYYTKGNNQDKRRFPRRSNRSDIHNRCFICKKEDCRSWKHTPQEQATEKASFRAKYQKRFQPNQSNPSSFNKRFDKTFRQYVSTYEGDGDSDSDLDKLDTFESLFMENESDTETETEPITESYITSIGALSKESATSVVTELANRAFLHQVTNETLSQTLDSTQALEGSFISASKYDSRTFQGIMIDTGAAKCSTAGYGQFQAFRRNATVELNITTKGAVTVQFGIGASSSIGSALITTPIGLVNFHIMTSDTPFLLSLADLDRLGVYFNNMTNHLVTTNSSQGIPVIRRFGHPFLLWDTSLQSYLVESMNCFLTNTELQRLHRRFGHPSVNRLQRVLERAGHNVDKSVLEYISKYCIHCQRHSKSPGRFKFNLREDLHFNATIIVDIFYIEGRPVLHIVDEATRYQAGRWLQNMTSKHTWDTIRACWIDTYLGPPDQITTDAGKNFIGKEFNQLANTVGTKVKIVPVEAHNSIGIVERYHSLIRRAYVIIAVEIRDIDKDMALQMAFKAINDSAGPDGLIPTLLVYGAYPRLAETDTLAPSVSQRALAVKKAMIEIQKLRAKRQVMDALNTRNGPNTTSIHELTLNSDVLVWREGNAGQNGTWKGPYKLISTDGESSVLSLPYGNTTFRNTAIKPFLAPEAPIPDIDLLANPEIPLASLPEIQPASLPENPPKRGRGRPRKYPISTHMSDITVDLDQGLIVDQIESFLQEEHQFADSRRAEISGLLEKGVFKVITSTADIPQGARIFNSRFVDEVKNKGDQAFNKSRLVVQAYNDNEKHTVLTQLPTIQRVSQRLILCLTAMFGTSKGLYLRDISQAYVQSITLLNRDFYVWPPLELIHQLGLKKGSILRVVKPLYGIPEAGNHWFKTYHSHHLKELNMDQSTYDPCLLYSNNPFGVVGLQTDDTLILATHDFAEQEEIQLQKAGFLAKDRECLTPNKDLKFNGAIVHMEESGNITITQERQCQNLQLVNQERATTTSSRGATRKDLNTKEQYVAQRARGAYIASVCQPEAAFDLSVAAQATELTENDIKALNIRIKWQKENAARGLYFTRLDKDSLQLLVFTDASFANNKDLSSQIGYVLVLADSAGKGNILHWSSVKCKRVTRSVLASELYAMAYGFDISMAIKSTVDKILGITVPIVLCTDSKSLYDCLVKLGTTAEKRLMIDIMCLRQAYERHEIAEVKWIKGSTNPADSMTKSKASGALKQLLDTNRVQLEVVEWVERKGTRAEGGEAGKGVEKGTERG